METCKYCGHSGGHTSSCPVRFQADPTRLDSRESSVPGFTVAEVHSLVGIVDTWRLREKLPLDRLTRENAPALIEAEVRRTAAERNKLNGRDLEGLGPDDLIAKLYNRNSSSHAFQCSVNKAEDFGAYHDRVRKLGEERGMADDRDVVFLSEFLRRQEKMHDLMTGLLTRDIARRFGIAKGDEGYFEDAMKDFPALAGQVLASLDEYERADATQLEEHEDAREQVALLRERLEDAAKDPAGVRDYYGDICMLYSILIFADAENFNEEKVRAAAKRLEDARA